jgi:hypothetical protein
MGFKCGIVGLSNVGKSTLFNALTQSAAAEAANYPFTTIEPNVGEVPVPDPRLEQIFEIAGSAAMTPARLTFVDIAGLVRGASKGEGLGNQFLGQIREVDAIAHVLRCFEDDNVSHVEGRIDPVGDAETVETELMLADIESLEKRVTPLEKKIRGGDKEAGATLDLVREALEVLNSGQPLRSAVPAQAGEGFGGLELISAKPVLYVCNVDEAAAASGNAHSAKAAGYAKGQGAGMVVIAAKIEAELAQLDAGERDEYLAELGLDEPGLNRMIRAGYELLGLITFFTANANETRAWTIARGTSALKAAGVVHTDFEKGFVRAETIPFEDYLACAGEAGARDTGKMRLEGKDYLVQDGDVLRFRSAP